VEALILRGDSGATSLPPEESETPERSPEFS